MGACNRPNTSPVAQACPRGLTVMSMSSMRTTHFQLSGTLAGFDRLIFGGTNGSNTLLFYAPGPFVWSLQILGGFFLRALRVVFGADRLVVFVHGAVPRS